MNINITALNAALVSYCKGKFLFNMCANKAQPGKAFVDQRFLIIELFDSRLRQIGILVWDEEQQVIKGVFLLLEKEALTYEPVTDAADDFPLSKFTKLDDYKWIASSKEIYLYFVKSNGDKVSDYCISNLDTKPKYESC